MKNLFIALLVSVLMTSGLSLTTTAQAKDNYRSWTDTLTQDQRQQVVKLKLDFKKVALPIKAQIKQARIELAMLVTNDNPDAAAIDSKIEKILKLKGEKMRARVKLGTQIRKILSEEQRSRFDLHVLNKASQGKQRRHHNQNHEAQ